MLKAITRQARLVDQKVAAHNESLPPNTLPITIAHFFDHFATDEDTNVTVAEEDFDAARRELVPSVSYEELQHYEGVRKAFEGNGSQKAIEGDQKQSNARKAIPLPSAGPASVARRESSAGKGKTSGKALGYSSYQGRIKSVHDGEDFDEDDPYTIRTEHLSINGNGRPASTENGDSGFKEKGKGKWSVGITQQAFSDAAGNDEEELYS